MFEDLEGRIDRLVDDLLKGRRLRLRARDSAEREAIMAAAALAAAREGHPRMSPGFRRRLAATLAGGGEQGKITRRTALGAVAGLAAGVTGAAALSRLPGIGAAPRTAASSLAGGLMRPGAGSWVRVAAFTDLSETVPTRVVAGDLVAFLFRRGTAVSGISGMCSHWPCALDWKAADGALNCPCHNVDFNPDGRTSKPNYDVPALPAVKVKVDAGEVFVFSP
jgi:nitrite reductase/ring-hydroxylating ferredoxin subunit